MSRTWKVTSSTFRFFDTFSELSDDELEELVSFSQIVEYPKGEIVSRQGIICESLTFIMSGALIYSRKLLDSCQIGCSKTVSNTSEIVLQIFGAGDCCGDVVLFVNSDCKGSVKALKDTRVLSINKKALREFVSGKPQLLISIIQRISSKFLNLVESIDMVQGRLQDRIDILSQQCSKNGIDLNEDLSKTEVAKMLGVTRVGLFQSMKRSDRVEE